MYVEEHNIQSYREMMQEEYGTIQVCRLTARIQGTNDVPRTPSTPTVQKLNRPIQVFTALHAQIYVCLSNFKINAKCLKVSERG